MQVHQLRVVQEYSSLESKIDKLQTFLHESKTYNELIEQIGKDEYDRMSKQLTAMYSYRDALYERIKAF